MTPQSTPAPGAARNLGILAKSSDRAPGRAAESPDPAAYRIARRDRFNLARTAGRLLFRAGVEPGEQHRTCWCHRGTPAATESLSLFRRVDGSSARLRGVTTCGSVWACPVCSGRVAEARREELDLMLTRAAAAGHHAYLLTLTFPHERGHRLADLLQRQARALNHFKTSKTYRAMRARYNRRGNVRSLEITYGANGWHPHTHDVMIAAPGLETDLATVDGLRAAWIDAIRRAGLLPQEKLSWAMEHAFDLRGGQYTADYVSKFGRDARWNMAREVTKGQSKIGMRAVLGFDGHCTPFQLLAWAHAGDQEAEQLYRVYAFALEGKRMLSWSPGLKREFGILDRTDEEAAAADRPDELKVGTITPDDLGKLHARCALGEFIALVAEHCCNDDPIADQAEIRDILDHLTHGPPTYRGFIRVKRFKSPGFNVFDPAADPGAAGRFLNS